MPEQSYTEREGVPDWNDRPEADYWRDYYRGFWDLAFDRESVGWRLDLGRAVTDSDILAGCQVPRWSAYADGCDDANSMVLGQRLVPLAEASRG